MHPDGRTAVFVESWVDEMDDTARSALRVWDGHAVTAFHEGNVRERSPRFSPDGKVLAYFSDHDGKSRLWLRSFPEGEERSLDLGGRSAGNLTWSPDGKWLAFYAFAASKPAWNPTIPEAPAGAKWAPKPTIHTTMRWSMDGSGISQPGSSRLFVAAADGSEVRQVSHEPYWHTSYLNPPELTWRADSRALIAPAVKAADGWAVVDESILFEFPIAGGEPKQLGESKWHQRRAAVSPDGKTLAWVGFAWRGQSYHVGVLHAGARALTPKLDRDPLDLEWSADGKRIYFLTDSEGETNLHGVDLEGNVSPITRGRHRIGSYAIAPNGQGVAVVSTGGSPSVLRKLSIPGGLAAKASYDPNAQSLAGCRLAQPEEIRYRSFDGLMIHGWLLAPADFDPARKYPLLVSIHGGPHASYGNGYVHELQMYADHGYLVLYTNPRGSTGYGEEFARIIQHRWPGDDIKDVLAGVDFVAQRTSVDRDRLGVIGASGGGLMTAWMVTATDRFKAAVAWYPVTNWTTHVGSGDNGFYIASVYRKGMPWEQPDDYQRHSPLFHIAKVNTPTMILTGDEDWRTPIAQTHEFYRALKVRGVDTVMLRYPGEAHGILKRPSHRVSVVAHSLAWLDKYLKP
jgi:acylaminoacyl-peptidase